jgi:hypothetical protein
VHPFVLPCYSVRLSGSKALNSSFRHLLSAGSYTPNPAQNSQYAQDLFRFSVSDLKKVVHLDLEAMSALLYAPNSPM